MKFKECCIDAYWMEFMFQSSTPIQLRDYVERFINISKEYKPMDCVSAFPLADIEGFSMRKYLMVTTCSSNVSDVYDQLMCLYSDNNTLEGSIPVLGEDKYVYKNVYCARCNNVEEYRLVNVTMVCRHCLYQPRYQKYSNGSYR